MKTKTLSLLGSCLLMIAGQSCSTVDELNNTTYPSSYKQIHNELVQGERTAAGPIRLVVETGTYRVHLGGIDTRGKAVGAAGGVLGGAWAGLEGSEGAPLAALVLVPAGAVVGGVVGAAYVADKDEITGLIQQTSKTINAMDPGSWLVYEMHNVSGIKPGTMVGGYATPAAAHVQDHSVLRIRLLSVGCKSARYDPHFFSRDVVDVVITTSVQLKRASDRRILYEGHYLARSKASDSRSFEDWTANGSRLLVEEIRTGMHRIAESVLTDVFQCLRPQLTRIDCAPGSFGADLNKLAQQKDAGKITYEEYQQQLKQLMGLPDQAPEEDHAMNR